MSSHEYRAFQAIPGTNRYSRNRLEIVYNKECLARSLGTILNMKPGIPVRPDTSSMEANPG